jgi:hypothetical protein
MYEVYELYGGTLCYVDKKSTAGIAGWDVSFG